MLSSTIYIHLYYHLKSMLFLQGINLFQVFSALLEAQKIMCLNFMGIEATLLYIVDSLTYVSYKLLSLNIFQINNKFNHKFF
jgi:hypothetical protein